jgi:soluble lytic murein transglycosylase-like protein
MEFTQSAKERLTLTLKSSLLCAVILMPAALAQSMNGADRVDPTQTTLASASSFSSSNPDSSESSDSSASTHPVNRRKADRLSGHIQRKYQVPDHKADQIVVEAIRSGQTHQVDPELILAIIAVESTFKERAVSREGARGLMQVLPRAHPTKIQDIGGARALFDPVKNIHTGSRILNKYLDMHDGNLRRALLKYNGSLGTRSSFADRVMRIYQDFRRVTTEG